MNPDNPKSPNPAAEPEETGPNPEIEAFFQRLPGNLHWPPPTEAAIAAAVEAIQRMAGNPLQGARASRDTGTAGAEQSSQLCPGCGSILGNGMRFCGNCGLPVHAALNGAVAGNPDVSSLEGVGEGGPGSGEAVGSAGTPTVAQHHYHHHYHHFVGTAGGSAPTQQDVGAPQGRASSSAAPGSRAELSAKQVAQEWAQACNTKHLDDLVELYASDATLIRPNVSPVRSAPSIREFLFAALEAGLGDVEMDSLRTEVFGEIALDLGRCKMLVPVAMGKRREERGKYLLVMARQPAGHWKIVADCWSTDLSVSGAAPSEGARKAVDPATKKPR